MPRQPLDADIHKLKGTKSVAAEAGTPALPPGRPKFPQGISADARRVFKRLCGLLERRQVLTPGDAELLRLYAVAYTRHQKALAKMAVEGEIRTYVRLDSNGQPHDQEKPNLWLKVAQDAERTMVACLDRLGLTPMNRNKVRPTATVKPVEVVDPEADYFNRLGEGRSAATEPATDLADFEVPEVTQ